jgi:cytochrome c oxidase cbb3-type subunit 3
MGVVCANPGLARAAADTPAGSPSGVAANQGAVLDAPVSPILPGNPGPLPGPGNPYSGDAAAVERGMRDFVSFNCVGCHAPNGGGGMGPSLSDDKWLHGSSPAQVFLSIYQGRSNGMPAWGKTLPTSQIWDLVAYVEGLSRPPGPHFGTTLSRTPPMPKVQQVPAEFLKTTDPWRHIQPFGNGKKPEGS